MSQDEAVRQGRNKGGWPFQASNYLVNKKLLLLGGGLCLADAGADTLVVALAAGTLLGLGVLLAHRLSSWIGVMVCR